MQLYDRVSDLPLNVEDCRFETLEREVSGGMTRVTTLITLEGDGYTGQGEDVTYEPRHHHLLAEREPSPSAELAGEFTLHGFSRSVGSLDLFPEGPDRPYFRNYRRWGFESAALDLALKTAGKSLAEALGREYSPVRFVVSPRLGDPPNSDIVERWLDIDPDMEFKLDASAEWKNSLGERFAETGRVRVVDLKGMYEQGNEVAQPPDPELYRMVRDLFPDTYIEDPCVTEGTRPVLEPVADRVTWDKPVTSVDSLSTLPFPPSVVNVKPSRFGSVKRLLDTIEHCERNGIGMYGGGQFELGVGRAHVQALASLFYPDAPNDVSPRDFHVPEPRPGVPHSPLTPPEGPAGMEWRFQR